MPALLLFLIFIIFLQIPIEFKDISHITLQKVADSVHSAESDALGFSASKNGQIRFGDAHFLTKLLGSHPAVFQHLFQMHCNRQYPHLLNKQIIVFLQSLVLTDELRSEKHPQNKDHGHHRNHKGSVNRQNLLHEDQLQDMDPHAR